MAARKKKTREGGAAHVKTWPTNSLMDRLHEVARRHAEAEKKLARDAAAADSNRA